MGLTWGPMPRRSGRKCSRLPVDRPNTPRPTAGSGAIRLRVTLDDGDGPASAAQGGKAFELRPESRAGSVEFGQRE